MRMMGVLSLFRLSVCAVGLYCATASAETKAWWRLNGTNGEAALPVADDLHGYQFASEATTPIFTNTAMRSHVFTDAAMTTLAPSSGTANGSMTVPSVSKPVALSAADTAAIFEADENGKFKSFTVELVFRCRHNNAWEGFLGFNGPKGVNLALKFNGGLEIRSDYDADDSYNKTWAYTGGTFSTDTWHHFALIYDASTRRLATALDYTAHTWFAEWAYELPRLTGTTFRLGSVDGASADLVVDEVRISSGVLTTSEMLRPVNVPERPADFLYPLNEGAVGSAFTPADPRAGEGALELVATGVTGVRAAFNGRLAGDDGLRLDATVAAAFSGATSGLVFAHPQFVNLEGSDFTLEAFVQADPQSSFTLFAHGAAWSLALAEGVPVWTCAGVPTALGDADVFADGACHHLTLVADRGVDETSFVFFIDGVAVGSIPPAAMTTPCVGDFVAFSGLTGRASGFRGTPAALSPTAFLQREEADPRGLIGHWTLDSSAGSGTSVADLVFPANHGLTVFAFKADAANTTATVSDDVPASLLWNEADGRLVNGDNRSSVSFSDSRGLIAKTGVHGFPDEYTVEFFAKVTGTAKAWQVYADFDHCWMFDTFGSATAPVADLRMDNHEGNGKVANTNGGPAVSPDAWHHVALTAKKQENDMFTYTVYVDYVNTKSVSDRPATAYADWPTAALRLGWGNNVNFTGLIDEFRITGVALDSSQFMRAFTPRADLAAMWFASGSTLSGADVLGGPDYLTATWGADVTTSSDLPLGGPSVRFLAGDAKVARTKCSAAFSGGVGASVPAIATAGVTSFTFEAMAKGVGEVVGKARDAGLRTWAMGIGTDGKPYVRFDTVKQGALTADPAAAEIAKGDSAVDAGAWHHLALTVDRSDATVSATLYVDGVAAASLAPSSWVETADDIKVGEGFVGNVVGLRLSPTVLTPSAFLRAASPSGLSVIIR